MHRRLVVVLLIVIIATTVIDATKKVEDWDELESLLENIDEIGETKKATAATIDGEDADVMVPTKEMAMADGVDDDDDDPLERDRITKSGEVKTNPCEDYVCGWGKECIVDKKHAEPTCECIRDCPESTTADRDPNDQVCSSSNETFPSLCHLYRQRCLCKRQSKHCHNVELAKAHLEYLGACKQLDECTDELMEQFPGRMADWLFQVMRELKKRRELHNLEWEELINEAETDDEKKHVYPVIWKFCDLDIKPQDKHVSHHELIPITAPVIPMESCIKPFLEKCDSDSDGSITIHEWGRCLGLKEGEIQERC